MGYRVVQWSTGNVGRHALRCIIAPSRPRARRACGCTAPTRSGSDAGELVRPRRPTGVVATNDADALLALDADCVCYTATGDLRPNEAVDDMCRILESGKNVVSTLGRAARLPAHRRPAMRCASSRTACRRAARRASRRASTRASPTTCCRSSLTGCVRAHRLGAGDGDPQLRHLRPARGALRDHGLRQAARQHAAAAAPRRAHVRVGRRGRT